MMSISSVLEGEIEAVGGARALGRAAVDAANTAAAAAAEEEETCGGSLRAR